MQYMIVVLSLDLMVLTVMVHEDEFNSAGTTLRQLRHTGILDSAMQVRTPDVAVVPTEISS